MITWDWAIDGWIILVGVLSGCSCALVGNYLVLRRQSLMGDAISHAVLPGLAIAFMIKDSRSSMTMFLGAAIVGVLTALLTQAITLYGRVERGAAMGVVFSILFAIGLVLIRRAADHVDLDPGCVLYGNIVQVPLDAIRFPIPPAVVNLSVVLVVNMLFVGFFYKELKISSFDPDLATTLGINASAMHYALMVMVAVTTVANFEAVGSILVIAMLIVPAAAAHLLTDRLGVMIAISLTLAALAAVVGHVLAAFGPGWVGVNASVNSAGMIAVIAGVLLLLAILFSPHYGLIARGYDRLNLASRIVRQDVLGLLYRWQEMQVQGAEPMTVDDVLHAVGNTYWTRRAFRRLQRLGEIEREGHTEGRNAIRLTASGAAEAAQLVGSHRLWEAYLAKHFRLPTDHLHQPAERMEHFITPDIREELRQDLAHPTIDPQGKPIPDGGDRLG